jgi:alcohol dehydrogenase class IV
MDVNIRALRARAPESEPLRRYQIVARLLTGNDSAAAEGAVEWVSQTCRDLGIPPLRAYGITEEHAPALVAAAAKASSMKANPIPLTPAELAEVLSRAL